MQQYRFYLLNVFAESHFGGNPLAVFPEADGLNDAQMQLIARQFNLSETLFVQKSSSPQAVRKFKIFTPNYEMPFAGHPTIGASFVIHKLLNLPENYQIETQAGLVEIYHQADVITFALKNGVQTRASDVSKVEIAQALGLSEADIALEPVWVNTGTWQLLVRLASDEAVQQCCINSALFLQNLATDFAPTQCYVWYAEQERAHVRFFAQDGVVLEDLGTGSAAANLGGWHIAQQKYPFVLNICQGDELNRPNRLRLEVDTQGTIFVGGKVIEVGSGEFSVA